MNDPRKSETLDVINTSGNLGDGFALSLALACVSVALAILALACEVYGVTW